MKVALDSGPLTSEHAIRGIGVHTHELIEGMKRLRDEAIKVDGIDFKDADLSKYDVVHYPYFHPFFLTLPWQKPIPKVVVTIHDLIPLIYPKHYPPGIKGKIRFLIQEFLLRNIDAIITISETSKKDICRFLGVQPNKVHVVYLAPRRIFRKIEDGRWKMEIAKHYGLPERFVLYVGDVNYNKNIPTLIKTCKLAKIPLVICGKQAKDIKNQDLNHPELLHLRNVDFDKTIRLGFVPDKDLVAIYNLASVYCQPSFYEGFGLPILESFACETPVVASKTQALVEIGEGGALFASPKDPEDFAKQILKIVNDGELKNQLVSTGNVIVRNFSWEKTAKETLEVYKSVYENK